MIGSLAWRALMRRNLIYRKRNWLSSIFEFILPFCFVWIMVAIRNAADVDEAVRIDAKLPQDFPGNFANIEEDVKDLTVNPFAFRPFSYYDYEIAMQAKRICSTGGDEGFDVSGIEARGHNWQVPFIRCDGRHCTYLGEDAQPFCEYMMLALSSVNGGDSRALEFKEWFYERFPVLSRNKTDQQSGTPFDFDFVQIFGSPSAMDDYVKSKTYGVGRPKIAMGIVFDGSDEFEYKYWIRQNSTNFNAPMREVEGNPVTQTTPPTNRLFNDFANSDFETCVREPGQPSMGLIEDSCTGQYVYNGVLATQRLIGDFILNKTGAEAAGFGVADASVQYVQFPQEAFNLDGFFATVEQTGPLLMALGLLYPVATIISRVVREKELRQKELMKMMSVTESDIGWSWFASFFLFHLCTATVTTIISSILYEHSSIYLLWIFWALSYTAIVVFCLAVSSLSSKNARAVLIGLLVFFSGIFLYLAFDRKDYSRSLINFLSLHPVTALSYGVQALGRLEDIELGLVSSTLDFSDIESGHSFQDVLNMLGIGMIVWGTLSWYLNRVIPPAYGQGLPLWFPLVPSYWSPSAARSQPRDMPSGELDDEIPVEPVSRNLERLGEEGSNIEIKGLKKVYKNKTAVDGLTLSMYRGQITALLGHNGAGKTTTINMLTGATAPSAGYATVAGKDIHTDMSAIRKDIGICLQHDCLFPQLTVREHVQFFARLKGLYAKATHEEAERQIDQSIRDVALYDKRNTLSKNLSGGMKRKLSVAIAFCGGSRVVMLDEPTSGMDPFSRRFTWDVIRQYRENRCIILTTHFMDEADILGDRIAIMADGRLCCVGSSLFLKKTYGVGYQLTIEKSTHYDSDSEVNTDSSHHQSDLQSIVMEYIDDAKLLGDVGSELTYRLPLRSSSGFTGLFERLDEEKKEGTVASYGISITTLDEVFLMVTRGHGVMMGNGSSRRFRELSSRQSDGFDEKHLTQSKDLIDFQNDNLFFRHVTAMLWKRASYFRRDRKAWVCTAILPSIFVVIGLLVFVLAAPDRNLEPLPLVLSDYNPGSKENIITYNSVDNNYYCQPGVAAYPDPLIDSQHTEETYLFGGYEGKLIDLEDNSQLPSKINPRTFQPTNEYCSISVSDEVMGTIAENGVIVDSAEVRNVSESSLYLQTVEGLSKASKYGAIWFTHDTNSQTSRNRKYSTAVIEQCTLSKFFLDYVPDCNRFDGVGYVIQYNHTAIHAALMFEAIANEALVRRGTGNSEYSVSATIAPLPITDVEENIGAGEDAFAAWFLVMLSFPFIAGAYATFVVTEKKTKAKHLQTVAGVNPVAYWLATFIWDTLNYQIPLWLTVALIFAFDVNILTTSDRDVFSGILAILCLYGPATAGFTYCISFAFRTASMCNVFVISFGFLIGMGGPLTCFILTVLGRDPRVDNPKLEDIAEVLTWFLRITPSFCLGDGLFRAINIDVFIFLAGAENLSAWSEHILLYDVYFLLGQTFVYLCLAMLLDRWSTNPQMVCIWRTCIGFVKGIFTCCCKNTDSDAQASRREVSPFPPDDDVLKESERVRSRKATDDLIVMRNLRKVYEGGKVAVDDVSLGIAPGECFGLLGINGAGKTTTLAMLTAEFPPTSGDATLLGYSLTRHPEKIRRRIGYCPQFDAHFDNLTGREHVELYASIKGIPKHLVSTVAAQKLQQVGLSSSDSDRLSSEYSGGMKRRLSLACATVGQPQVIFLDECSTGVDPVARHEIWKLVADMVAGHGLAQHEKPSVVLTTHSMDECEALCPRIGIMAQGRLCCLGSALHLKNKFGKGYQVELKHRVVSKRDEDYKDVRNKLKALIRAPMHVEECRDALVSLTGTSALADMVKEQHGPGFAIWRDASSIGGVSLDDLAAFATSQIRTFELEKFVGDEFPNYVLRERQDTKSRFEISSERVKISKVFRLVEENKDRLYLSDYSVSQTSLEQVFNLLAAEAETRMTGRMDALRPISTQSSDEKEWVSIPAVTSNSTSRTQTSPASTYGFLPTSRQPEIFDDASEGEVTA